MVDLDTLKDYLNKLNQYTSYLSYLKRINKKDNVRNIKNYFNKYIFISIKDFTEGHYDKLFVSNKDLKNYIRLHPDKKTYKNIVKKEKLYRIFLRQIG
tara:strand:- start:635 stop:928 length:294 start_codon:yes stop_codon:yes gene_type:complete